MQHRISILQHGAKSGTSPGLGFKPDKFERGTVQGWSTSSARRNTEFLQSVDYDQLDGLGLAFTGTIRDCPPTGKDWEILRQNFIRRLRRLGLIRYHWVTEWQRRGVPHLHGMLFFPDCSGSEYIRLVEAIRSAWLVLTEVYGSAARGVHLIPMTDKKGWAEYTGKHAARGVNHYQRSREFMPKGWQGLTGRIWGKGGDWPTCDAMKFHVDAAVFYRQRRLIRSWRIAEARAEKNTIARARRIRFARGSLRCNDRPFSSVRGVNDWIPQNLSMQLLYASAAITGGSVEQHG